MVMSIKDLMCFYDCSLPTAIKRKKELINYFGIPSKKVWLTHVAQYEGLTVDEVKYILKVSK